MNIFTYRNVVTGRIFAVLAAVSMILSTLPVSFLIADAAVAPVVLFNSDFESGSFASEGLVAQSSWTIATGSAASGTMFAQGVSGNASMPGFGMQVDTTGYENITVEYDFKLQPGFGTTYMDKLALAIGATPGVTSIPYLTVDSINGADIFPVWATRVHTLPATIDQPYNGTTTTFSTANNPNLRIKLNIFGITTSNVAQIDNLKVTGTPIAAPACTPQYNVATTTAIQNTDTAEYFNSIQDAIDDCDTADGNTILVTGGQITNAQITIDKELTLNGNGNAVLPTFAKTTNSNNSVFGVQADNVTLKNFAIDGSGGTDLHGVNVYESINVLLDTMSFSDINRTAVVVNSSDVTIQDITTSGSGWHAINVDQRTNAPAVLTVHNTSLHGESSPSPTPHIYVDDNTRDVTINDVDNQYDKITVPIPFDTQTPAGIILIPADIYTLKSVTPTSSLTITAPASDNEVFEPGMYTFEAEYVDADPIPDPMRWAIRPGCTSSINLAGNVGGLSDVSTYDGAHFEADVDMSTWADGEYCFIVNPAESGGNVDLREVRPFTLETLYTVGGYKWNDVDGNGVWGEESTIPGWNIALRPMDMSPLEELFVSADSSVVTSTTTLLSGRTYVVEVSGTYSFGNRPDFVADAEWTHRTDAFQDSPLLPHGWTLGENTYPSVVGLDLQINNQNIDWGAFNDSHLYKTLLEGGDVPLDFFIYDSYYGDNTGGLSVAIYDVTDYATSTNDNGYYSFQVPAGEYQIVEEMIDGWSQTYPAGPSYYHMSTTRLAPEYNFGNQQDAVPQGELIVKKVIVGAEATPDMFTFSVSGGDGIAFEADGENNLVLDEGVYSITELPVADYDVSYDGCVEVVVQEGANTTPVCTITNTYHPPAVCEVGVNLLENPSFEEPVITSTWSLVTPVAWLVETLGGGSGLDMEIQRNVNGWLASDGDQYTELDSTESSQMSQMVDTVLGATYSLSWDFAGRPYREVLDNHLEVLVDGVEVADNQNAGGGDNIVDWLHDSATFTGTGNPMEIMFRDAGTSNSYGTFVDNVSLTCEPLPTVGPYCGDGEINQDWEQCELGDTDCTDYCTFANQCTDLRLVKINLNSSDSVSFDDTVYLGSASNPIPNGSWFNFDEVGDVAMNTIGNSVDGLAVSRDTANDELVLGFVGGNDSGEIDYAIGSIQTLGITLGGINRNPITQWKLEDGTGGSFNDVFTQTGTTINFDLRADTGRDGVSVEVASADTPYNCPVTQRISGYKWNDENGDGIWDDSEQPLAGWDIVAIRDDGVELATTTDDNGYYYFDATVGQWTITEVQQEGWVQTGLVQNGRSQQDNGELLYTSCTFDLANYSLVQPAQVFTTDSFYLEASNSCYFGNQVVPSEEETTEPTNQTEHNYGARISRGPAGQVLGASTSNQCPFLLDYMQIGVENNPWEVKKLQSFLDIFVAPNPVTGFFGEITDRNVKKFQEQYRDEILLPWFENGIVPNTNPTGFVYKTTLWKINSMVCPDYAELPNFEGEDLTKNVDID